MDYEKLSIEELIALIYDENPETRLSQEEAKKALSALQNATRKAEKAKLYDDLEKEKAKVKASEELVAKIKSTLTDKEQIAFNLQEKLSKIDSEKLTAEQQYDELKKLLEATEKEKELLKDETNKSRQENDEKLNKLLARIEDLDKKLNQKELEDYKQNAIKKSKLKPNLVGLVNGSSQEQIDASIEQLLTIQADQEKELKTQEEKIKELEQRQAAGGAFAPAPDLASALEDDVKEMIENDPEGFLNSDHPIAIEWKKAMKIQ